ncbi:MAG: hypothetical protein LBV12_10065 [Puniceicoccales bacterium]|jgi:hypothetical protein|nr:hypothetical protein [Puniceicoccales bacterium]
MENEITTGLFALAGVLIGGGVTFFTQWFLEKQKIKNEARAATEAIIAEIEASLFLMEKRSYIDEVKRIIKEQEISPGALYPFVIIVPDDYCLIYKRHIEKIGLVPASIRHDIIRFYQLLEGLICDIKPGGIFSVPREIELFRHALEIAEEMTTIGKRILSNEKK